MSALRKNLNLNLPCKLVAIAIQTNYVSSAYIQLYQLRSYVLQQNQQLFLHLFAQAFCYAQLMIYSKLQLHSQLAMQLVSTIKSNSFHACLLITYNCLYYFGIFCLHLLIVLLYLHYVANYIASYSYTLDVFESKVAVQLPYKCMNALPSVDCMCKSNLDNKYSYIYNRTLCNNLSSTCLICCLYLETYTLRLQITAIHQRKASTQLATRLVEIKWIIKKVTT